MDCPCVSAFATSKRHCGEAKDAIDKKNVKDDYCQYKCRAMRAPYLLNHWFRERLTHIDDHPSALDCNRNRSPSVANLLMLKSDREWKRGRTAQIKVAERLPVDYQVARIWRCGRRG
jgi:hypothetical protein